MRQLCFDELLLNPSVSDKDLPRLSKQSEGIWEIFCAGPNRYRPVWTSQLRIAAAQYFARINELRTWLRRYGLTIDVTGKNDNGNHRYEVRTFEGSNYQRLLLKRGQG